jgi:hypothetical protein
VECQEQACRAHCLCGRLIGDGKIELASGRSAARPQPRPGGAAAAAAAPPVLVEADVKYSSRATGKLFQVQPSPAPAPAPAPVLAPAPVRAPAAKALPRPSRLQSRSRSREGRRNTRSKIRKAHIDQWRLLAIPDRPMPSGRGADIGLLPGATWEEALRKGKDKTEELLREGTYHSSVRLSLYLEWAAEELRQRSVAAQGGLEVRRHILNFLR